MRFLASNGCKPHPPGKREKNVLGGGAEGHVRNLQGRGGTWADA